MDQSDYRPAIADLVETGLNARDLSRLSDLLVKAVRTRERVQEPPLPVFDSNLAAIADELYRVRRKREAIFGAVFGDGMFADPAWDLLLDLYVQNARQRQISVSSACLAAAVPTTTALRYISDMLKRGVIARTPHPVDGRSHLLSLTEPAIAAMENLLRQLRPSAAATTD